ncbi:O-acetyl-ADP-ribose deacetylase [Nitrosophilus alvini]|uniref:O-acetyl-ADP-ribose deacetylase n=1 Tax=Nitrosophilus alvini TaxID=2714855 RepID=UPI00190C1D62|nr:O-acetyl-ADP-ribose deacetylase [Nitrosophilus alvini]
MIKITIGDITKIETDAIVNAANPTLLGGGGVDGAIHRAAGPKLLDECKRLGGAKRGEAKITHGYNLPAKWVIHTVGPVWKGGESEEEVILQKCYQNSLCLCRSYGLRSVAFPSISTGVYGFPIEIASKIALITTARYIKEYFDYDIDVVFVTHSEKDFEIYKKSAKILGIEYEL